MKPYTGLFSLLALCLLVGCSFLPANAPTSTAFPDPTAIYQTVSAQLTATAQPTVKRSAAATQAVLTPAVAVSDSPRFDSTSPIQPTPTPPCDHAAPGKPSIDISIPDNTPILPGQYFSKTWRLVNTGSCTWTKEYTVVWFSGERMSQIQSQPFSSVVLPGQSVDITIDFTSPQAAGIYQSNWMIRNPGGKYFGLGPTSSGPFYVRIEVKVARTHTPTPLPTFTPSPTLAVVARGTAILAADKKLDLDDNKPATDTTADLSMQVKSPAPMQIIPLNGAVISLMGSQAPTLADCKEAALRADGLPVRAEIAGLYICYRTSQSLPGIALIKTIDLKENKITLDFLTWAVP